MEHWWDYEFIVTGKNFQIMICFLENIKEDQGRLLSYLKLVDKDFGVPLSSKIDMTQYVVKLLSLGNVIVVMENEEIASCICFYCNDFQERKAYISLLSTLSFYQGKGYAKMLVNEAIRYCRTKRFQKIFVDSINIAAVSLYMSEGFRKIQTELINGNEKVILECEL